MLQCTRESGRSKGSGSSRRRRLGLGLVALAASGCRQMHQRHVFYPNGDGRRLVDVRTDGGVRVPAPFVDVQVKDKDGGKDVPPMLLGR
ncbi:MAG TPA: hypothetical protein VKP69_28540 [Isosphaeraceae bacterium]|nr:hypothetical protein [Isosphaeraceae bacterium]